MKSFRLAIGFLFGLIPVAQCTLEPAYAQSAGSSALATCGTATYTAGQIYPTTQDTTGKQCVNAAVSVNASITGFTPTAGATAALSASGTSADVGLPAGTDIVVTSPSTNTVPVFIRMQAGAGTAVTTDMPIVPGAAVGFHILTATHLSGITGGTAATLQIQGGAGLATGYGGGGGGSSSNASVSTNGAANPASSTQVGVSDGTNLQKVVAPIALGDGVNGNNTVSTGGFVWNGTTWDRMPGTTAGVKTTPGIATYSTTDKGGTITSGGVAQSAIASNASRKSWCVQNDPAATEILSVRLNGTASATTGTILQPGYQACSQPGLLDTAAVSVFAATTGHRWFGFEGQ